MKKQESIEQPFIHLFRTSMGYYFFDVNTDSIVKVTKDVYKKLNEYGENTFDPVIVKMKNYGLLQPNRNRCTKHPETEYIGDYFKRNMNTLVLQVTQNCNQRCSYCIYSEKYDNRSHNNLHMDFEMAKKGIDMILEHSIDAEELYFGFYGGEPLLEKELIRKCMEYIDDTVEGKKVYYNITTNATLLTSDIIPLLVKHKVTLLISLDGPENIHNKNRGFEKKGGNPHGIIIKNLTNLQHNYPKYYKECVSFNAVLTGKDGFSYIDSFFKDNKLFQNAKVMSTLVSDDYCKDKNKVDEEFDAERLYAAFLNLLTYIGRIKSKNSKLLETHIEAIDDQRKDKIYGEQRILPECSHHAGGCVPGIHKLFMTANGNFYPCEKVSESSEICRIGNINKGFNLDKISKLLNIELCTEEECKKCWAYQYCTVCLVNADGLDKISKERILCECKKVKYRVENGFKDYCVCKEAIKNYS